MTAPATKKAVEAVADEAKTDTKNTPVNFDYDGETYTVLPADFDDVEVLEDFEEGRVVIPLKRVLGADQWKLFKSKKRRSEELAALAEAMFEKVGVSLGE